MNHEQSLSAPITPLESSRVGVLGLLEPGTLRGPGVENKIIISPQFRHGKIPAKEPNKVIPGGQLSASLGGFYRGEGGDLKSMRPQVDIQENAITIGPAL